VPEFGRFSFRVYRRILPESALVRSKKVTRYWCDFCNKAGLQSRAMVKHELHCTLNPKRECRVCEILQEGTDLAALVAMLPDPTEFLNANLFSGSDNEYTRFSQAMKDCLPSFRQAANNCPACMMAALRLKKIPVPMVDGFDFKLEMQAILDDNRVELAY